MLVYCENEDCVHNKDGLCENKWPNGIEAISMLVTLGGDVICGDQKDKELWEDDSLSDYMKQAIWEDEMWNPKDGDIE